MTVADALAALRPPHDIAREDYRRLVRDDNPDVVQRDRYRDLVMRLASSPPRTPRAASPARPVQSIRLGENVAVAAVAVDYGVAPIAPCCGE